MAVEFQPGYVLVIQAPFRETCMGFDPTADYKLVWFELTSQDYGLEGIWRRFQRVEEGIQMPPEGYTARSLSIGDVICLNGRFYTPESVGFAELDLDDAQAVLQSIRRNFIPADVRNEEAES